MRHVRKTLALALCAGAGTLTLTGAMTGAMAMGNGQAGTTDEQTLQQKIDAYKAGFNQRADDETKRLFAEGIEAVVNAHVVEHAKSVGDPAPLFMLPDPLGEHTKLSTLLEDGPVVIVWYRGGWCPYCNLTLAAYQERLDEIGSLGATLVAISPELPDNALNTKEKSSLEFEVLTDANNSVAKQYGVVFELTPEVHAIYNDRFDFDNWNGQSSGELPLAATYVIDRAGVIRWSFLSADYRDRADPEDVIGALKALR